MGFRYGEFVLVICPSGVRRLLRLHNGGVYRWPRMTRPPLTHKDLVERESSYIIINKDIFRRPTLEEYVVLMDRVPAPTYPKDAQTMMAMLDIAGGDVVMEAGAGSGGLALHLSRSGEWGDVDSEGCGHTCRWRVGGGSVYLHCMEQ